MKWTARALTLVIVIFCAATLPAADKINTSYISTSPGSSTVIQVAKEARIFDKHDRSASCSGATLPVLRDGDLA